MRRRAIAHAIAVGALLLLASPPGSRTKAVGPNRSPRYADRIAGCDVWGTGVASHYGPAQA